MKKIARKPLLIFLIVSTVTLSFYFVYRTYQSYHNYQVVQSSDIYIDLIHHLDSTIRKLEEERLTSALYLGYKGKTEFQILAKKREESDTALYELMHYLTKYPQLEKIQKKFATIQEDLRYVRSRVDVINNDYQSLLFNYYQNKIITPLLKQAQIWLTKLSQNIDSVSLYFITSKELISMRDNLNQEQSYIAFILTRKQKMKMSDLVQWETILKNEHFPHLKRLFEKPIYNILKKSFHKSEITSTLTLLRKAVLKGIGNGNYPINTATWQQKMQNNINYVQETEKTLYDYLKSLDFKSVVPVALYINLLMILVTLVVLLLFVKLLKKTATSSQKVKEKNPDIQIKHTKSVNRTVAKQNVQLPLPESFPINTYSVTEEILDEDMPLTNIMPVEKEPILEVKEKLEEVEVAVPKEEKRILEESTFSPIQLFKEVIKPYISISHQKNISFHYAIDPSLPDICLGDRQSIKEILTLLLDSAMQNDTQRKEVILRIENIAQKKFETALSFTMKDSIRYISPDERNEIRRASSNASNTHTKTEIFTSTSIKNFIKARVLAKQLDGTLQIHSDLKEGTEFTVSINLKKFIST